jgi:hypothetical protein
VHLWLNTFLSLICLANCALDQNHLCLQTGNSLWQHGGGSHKTCTYTHFVLVSGILSPWGTVKPYNMQSVIAKTWNLTRVDAELLGKLAQSCSLLLTLLTTPLHLWILLQQFFNPSCRMGTVPSKPRPQNPEVQTTADCNSITPHKYLADHWWVQLQHEIYDKHGEQMIWRTVSHLVIKLNE